MEADTRHCTGRFKIEVGLLVRNQILTLMRERAWNDKLKLQVEKLGGCVSILYGVTVSGVAWKVIAFARAVEVLAMELR